MNCWSKWCKANMKWIRYLAHCITLPYHHAHGLDLEPRVSNTKSTKEWMLACKPIEVSLIKQKTWTPLPVPMISEHSAHSTPSPVGFHTWSWRYTFLLFILMRWHWQDIFELKGDKLHSSAECRILTQCVRHQIVSRLNTCWQTNRAIEDQAKIWNSTDRSYDQRPFSPLHPTASWLSHLSLAI